MKSKIWLVLITLYIVWGSTYLGIKVVIETIPPFFHAAVRFFVAGLILLAWQKAAGQSMPTHKQWVSTGIIGTLMLLGGNGLVSWAEQFISSGIAALIIATVPLWLIILNAIRPGGSKPSLQAMVGLAIGFFGIIVLAGPAEITGSNAELDPVGVLVILAATIFWAIGSIYSKTADLPKSSLVAVGAEMLVASVALIVASLLSGELNGWDVSAVSGRSLVGLVYLILIGSIIGFSSYGWLLKNAPLSLVATYAYVNPIIAVILGYLLGNEAFELRTGVAVGIIVGAVMLINIKIQPRVKKEALEVSLEKA